MMKRIIVAAVFGLTTSFAAVPARAQVFTPTYAPPRLDNTVGLFVSDGPGELGIEGIWRRIGGGGYQLGLRAGYADAGDGALLLGIEVLNPVVLAGAPIGLAFSAGAQGIVGDANAIGAQAGFSAGHTFVAPASNLRITPYIHPRLGVVRYPGADDDLELDVLADVGLDLTFATGFSFLFAANLHARAADWGVGVTWRQ